MDIGNKGNIRRISQRKKSLKEHEAQLKLEQEKKEYKKEFKQLSRIDEFGKQLLVS